jgi:WD40 repeat protein
MSLLRTSPSLALGLLLLAVPMTRGEPPADRQPPRTDRYGDSLPEGAVARLGTTRFRLPGNDFKFTGEAEAPRFPFALSPDGKVLATGEQARVRFWEMATGKEIRAVSVWGWVLLDIVLSPDGKLFAVHVDHTGGNADKTHQTLEVGEVASGKILHQLLEGFSGCREVVFSPDGATLAAFRHDELDAGRRALKGLLVLWDAHTGKELRQFNGVFGATFSPDGKILVVGKKDGSIQILDPNTGREVRRLEGHRASVQALAVSPDGRSLISADDERGKWREDKQAKTSVRLWDLETGKLRHRWPGVGDMVVSLQFSPDGNTVAVQGSKGDLLLYDAASGKERHRFPLDQENKPTYPFYREPDYAFSPDGKVLLLHDKGGPFREWDIARGEERRRWGGPAAAFPLRYSPDGKTAVSAGDAGLVVWDVTTGKELHAFPGHRRSLQALAFSPDGRFVASLDEVGVFVIWEARTGKPLLPMAVDKPETATRFRFAADGAVLSAVTKDLTASVWDLAGEMKVRRFRVGTKEPVRDLKRYSGYSPDGKRLAVVGQDNAIHLWDLAAGKESVALRGHRGPVRSLLFSDDSRLLASGSDDSTIRLWDAETGKELAHFRGGEKEVSDFQFSPDSKLLAWRWGDGLHVWDVAPGKELHRFAVAGDHRYGASFAFHRDSKTLAVAGSEAIHVWDVVTGKEIRTLASTKFAFYTASLFSAPDGSALASVAENTERQKGRALFDMATGSRFPFLLSWGDGRWISPDGKTLVWGSRTLQVIEMLTGETVGQWSEGDHKDVAAAAFAADGKLLATGGSDGSILVWDWRRACGLTPMEAAKIGARELEQAWDDLGRKPGKAAYRAISTLTAAGDEAVAWLGQRLQPVGKGQRSVVRGWIAALDDDRFEVREQASKELEQFGADAEPLLRQALAGELSLEARRRVESLLADIGRWPLPMLQKVRAVQALEQIGTARARELLEKLGRGVPEARLTREAQAALARLFRRR